MTTTTEQAVRVGVTRYFPHLAGSLVLAGAGAFGLLQKWEPNHNDPGLAYADKLAGGLPTVCRGLTPHVTSTPIVPGERWPADKCYREEQGAIVRMQDRLAHCFRVLPPQRIFDAASSHAWNNGAAATCGSLAMQAFNAGQWELGCQRLGRSDAGRPVWSFVSRVDPLTGKKTFEFVQGLANRRADETLYCRTGAVSGVAA